MRGCHATEKLNKDENVMSIPLKCLISVEMGKETYVRSAMLSCTVLALGIGCVLIIYALCLVLIFPHIDRAARS